MVDDVEGTELVVKIIPVVVNYHHTSSHFHHEHQQSNPILTFAIGAVVDGALVVTVPTVGGVVVFVAGVVDERPGSQMLKNQKFGSVTGADSGPTTHHFSSLFLSVSLSRFDTYHRIQYHLPHLHTNNKHISQQINRSPITYHYQTSHSTNEQ